MGLGLHQPEDDVICSTTKDFDDIWLLSTLSLRKGFWSKSSEKTDDRMRRVLWTYVGPAHLSDRELFGRREKVSVAYGRHRVAIVILVRVSSDHWSFYRLRMSWAWCSNDYVSYPNILISYLSTALFQMNVTTVLNLFPPFFISTLWSNLNIIVLES